MSVWPEEVTLEEFIAKENSIIGKDLYIAGVKRGLSARTISGFVRATRATATADLVNIIGSGWIIGVSSSSRSTLSGGDIMTVTGIGRVIIDGTKNIVCHSSAQKSGSSSVGNKNSSVSVNVSNISSPAPVDSFMEIDVPADSSTVFNAPIRFENQVTASISSVNYGSYDPSTDGWGSSLSITYILDPVKVAGG